MTASPVTKDESDLIKNMIFKVSFVYICLIVSLPASVLENEFHLDMQLNMNL